MRFVDVTSQAELDAALAAGHYPQLRGNGEFEVHDSSQVTAYDSSQVRACDSSQVRAYDSSQVRAYGSSQVTAYGSSQVRAYDSSQVTAYDSSQVTACDSSQVRAYDSSQVTASKYVAVTSHGARVKITGGFVIEIPNLTTAEEWCEFYGVEVKDSVATLYKAVRDDYKTSAYRGDYTPGTIPVAADWDGGKAECGGGLHFSPQPFMALAFDADATKFVGCPVRLADMFVHPDASMPQKCKARCCCAPVYEVTIDGVPVLALVAVTDAPTPEPSPKKRSHKTEVGQ